MTFGISLVIDTGRSEQIVRRPLTTDMIGASLCNAFGGATALPADMIHLLRRLDRVGTNRH